VQGAGQEGHSAPQEGEGAPGAEPQVEYLCQLALLGVQGFFQEASQPQQEQGQGQQALAERVDVGLLVAYLGRGWGGPRAPRPWGAGGAGLWRTGGSGGASGGDSFGGVQGRAAFAGVPAPQATLERLLHSLMPSWVGQEGRRQGALTALLQVRFWGALGDGALLGPTPQAVCSSASLPFSLSAFPCLSAFLPLLGPGRSCLLATVPHCHSDLCCLPVALFLGCSCAERGGGALRRFPSTAS